MGSEKIQKKLKGTLNAINTAPLTWSHKEKFKPLEGEKGVWEIKIKPHRIACIWHPNKPLNLIGFYYCKKDGQKWKQKDINAMRIAKEQLYNKLLKKLEADKNGWNKQLQTARRRKI